MATIRMLTMGEVALLLMQLSAACGSSSADEAAGSFDGSFLDYPGAERANFGLAAPDASAYYAGGAYKPDGSIHEELFVLKLNTAFEVDRSFGAQGVYRRSFTSEGEISAEVEAAAIDRESRIYLCASLNGINGARDQVLLVRLDSKGKEDPDFGDSAELRLDDRRCRTSL